ncbi:MAG: hypothetical protein ACRCX8_05165 [Sarcina sp.]
MDKKNKDTLRDILIQLNENETILAKIFNGTMAGLLICFIIWAMLLVIMLLFKIGIVAVIIGTICAICVLFNFMEL